MGKRKILFLLSTVLLSGFTGVFSNQLTANKVVAESGPVYKTSLTKNIDLKRNSESEIRNYYSNITTLSSEERTGINLLKNLRPILQNMDYFVDVCINEL